MDEGRVARLLRGIAERCDRLDAAGALAPDQRSELWLDGVKYLFVTTIEGCVDVAQHIGSSESFRAPDSNADAIRLLGEHGVVESELAASIARAVGFRNVLVHQYAAVDDRIVVGQLDSVGEFRAFVSEVSIWVAGQGD